MLISKTISFQSHLRFLIAFEIFFTILLNIMLTDSGLGKKKRREKGKTRAGRGG